MLDEILEVVLAEINEEHEKDYQLSDIEYDFKRSIMVNESENKANDKTIAETRQIEINTIMNAASVLDDDSVLQMVCEQFDIDVEEVKSAIRKQQEGSVGYAREMLETIPVEGNEPNNNVVEPTVE